MSESCDEVTQRIRAQIDACNAAPDPTWEDVAWRKTLVRMEQEQAARLKAEEGHVVDAHFAEVDEKPAPLAVIEPHGSGVLPVVSPDEAREAMTRYLEVCKAVLSDEDYQEFPQWDPKTRTKTLKKFKKKSAVKKLQTFWGVSVTIKESQRDDLGEGHFGFRVTARATNNQGRPIEATGGCSTFEERFDVVRYGNESPTDFEARAKKARARSYHDVLSTAETRATNRAVMNCIGVGGGEVTADEMQRPSKADNARDEADHRPPPHNAPSGAAMPRKQAPNVAEDARKAFDIAVKLGLCPNDKIMFRDYVREKYPALDWPARLKALEALDALADEGETDSLSTAFAQLHEAEAALDARTHGHTDTLHRRLEKRVLALCTALKINEQRRHEMTKRAYAHESLTELTEEQLREFGDDLENGKAA
jgi:hypothetical protein